MRYTRRGAWVELDQGICKHCMTPISYVKRVRTPHSERWWCHWLEDGNPRLHCSTGPPFTNSADPLPELWQGVLV